jgi:membrane protein
MRQAMTAPGFIGRLKLAWKQVLETARRLNEWSHGWIGMSVLAAREALKPDSVIKAAAIAYFSILSLFPLSLMSISIASFFLGSAMDQQLILQKIEFIAPALGQLLGENIKEIFKARGPVTFAAMVVLAWSASQIFYSITSTLSGIWNPQRKRPVWKRRGLALGFVIIFIGPVLFLASFASSMVVSLRAWLPDQVFLIGGGFSWIMAVLLDIALFMMLYIMLPHGASTWREILPGAIAAGLLWEFAKKAFLFFISSYITVSNMVYGSVAAIIAFLAWAYLSGLILLFGAFLSVSYYQRKHPTIVSGENKP